MGNKCVYDKFYSDNNNNSSKNDVDDVSMSGVHMDVE